MPVTSRTQLTWYLRQAFEQYLDSPFNMGPWDDLVEHLAGVIDKGSLSVADAARLDLILAETLGKAPARCEVCDCSAPGACHG
jgi:hypothetical protein